MGKKTLNKEYIKPGFIYWFLPNYNNNFYIIIDKFPENKGIDLKVYCVQAGRLEPENSLAIVQCYNQNLLDFKK